MRICVIFNPTARGNKARQFRDQLGALSTQVTLKPTYAAGTGRELAAEAVREGFETVVAAGGDGTLNEVLNGIGDVPEGFARTRLGVLPLGTINVFARELGLPLRLDEAWKVIEQGKELRIDLPAVQSVQNGQPCRRYFAQLAGAGLDSRAIELVDWNHKKLVGPLAYVVAGFKAMTEKKPRIVVSAPGVEASGELVLVGNGRFYGGPFELFPKASLTDGLLDITIFPKVNWEVLLRTGWGWLKDQLHATARCQSFRVPSFLLSASEQVRFEVDGESAALLPANFQVEPRSLSVLVSDGQEPGRD